MACPGALVYSGVMRPRDLDFSRRRLLQTAGAAAFSAAASSAPPADLKTTPQICLGLGDAGAPFSALDPAAARRITQLGVNHVLTGGGRISWEENQLREMRDRLKENGLTLGNL